MNDCVFCKIARKELKSEIILEGDRFLAFKDANPRVDGHTLVIPKKHFANLLDIPSNLGDEMIDFTKKVADKLMDEYRAHGFNTVMNNLPAAGQVVFHAHLHILPRKEDDGLKLDIIPK